MKFLKRRFTKKYNKDNMAVMRIFSALGIVALMAGLGCQNEKPYELVIQGAKVYNVHTGSFLEQNIGINQGKIEALSKKELKGEEVIAAMGQFVYPGFIDAHCHFVGYAQSLLSVDLTGTRSFGEVLERVLAFAEENPDIHFITGRGWDQNDWTEKRFPTNDSLNSLFPNTPVLLTRIDGHAALANNAALETITELPEVVEGGKILRYNGKPTGMLIDHAVDLIDVPAMPKVKLVDALDQAQQNCFAVGLTHVVDAGLKRETILLLDSLHKHGALKMPMYVMIKDDSAEYNPFFREGFLSEERLSVRSIKVYGDGALGSRGALLLEPYADDSLNNGLTLKKYDDLVALGTQAYKNGFQINVHAIGDSANRLVLKAMAAVLPDENDARWRIEHAQVVNPADSHYFSTFGIIPSVQPTHATSDMYWAEERLGAERIHHAYAFKSLMRWNGKVALGTDFPVEHIDPRKTLYAAVARQDEQQYPGGGFNPSERLSREDALRGMTIWAAYAQFQENETGSIEVGKWADLILSPTNFLTCEALDILEAPIKTTLVHGEIVATAKPE
jgi:predicted amidohydrolase YtcJ